MADDFPLGQDRYRSHLLSRLIGKREDEEQQKIIADFPEPLDFEPIDGLMISHSAWDYVQTQRLEPRLVFAHPAILTAHPKTSMYYRGIALLSQKRVRSNATSVAEWEDGSKLPPADPDKALQVACLYNTMISSIIEGSSDWTLENGYRNILATMGIRLDGMHRNEIGKIAEALVKDRIASWLESREIIVSSDPEGRRYVLREDIQMIYGSEPDINFTRGETSIATIEIKGGLDPAGALERLGAATKSFAATPTGCANFLIAGVITPEMQNRLKDMNNVNAYLLDDIAKDGKQWDGFTTELFHHAIRII